MDVELLVEGYTDEIFIRRCFEQLGISVGTVYGKQGIAYVRQKAAGFAVRGRFSPILILADFADLKDDCIVHARQALVAECPEYTLVRLAVREIESWLIASGEELASYLGLAATRIPVEPDSLADPKLELVNLARSSRKSRIRKMFVPKPGISSVVGPGYVDGFSEFMTNHWSLNAAVLRSPSFARFVQRAQEIFV